MNRKIIGSTAAIVAAIGLLGGGTLAGFSSEESLGQQFGAGTLEIELEEVGQVAQRFVVTDMAPGQTETVFVEVVNTGSIDGDASVTLTGLTTLEDEDEAFAEQLELTFQHGQLSSGACDLENGLTIYESETLDRFPTTPISLDNSDGAADLSALRPLGEDEVSCLAIDAAFQDLPDTENNAAQGGAVAFDLVFRLDQAQD